MTSLAVEDSDWVLGWNTVPSSSEMLTCLFLPVVGVVGDADRGSCGECFCKHDGMNFASDVGAELGNILL